MGRKCNQLKLTQNYTDIRNNTHKCIKIIIIIWSSSVPKLKQWYLRHKEDSNQTCKEKINIIWYENNAANVIRDRLSNLQYIIADEKNREFEDIAT